MTMLALHRFQTSVALPIGRTRALGTVGRGWNAQRLLLATSRRTNSSLRIVGTRASDDHPLRSRPHDRCTWVLPHHDPHQRYQRSYSSLGRPIGSLTLLRYSLPPLVDVRPVPSSTGSTHRHSNTIRPTKRYFHATGTRDIVPLIAAGLVVGMIGRYAVRAWHRMAEEQRAYLDALSQYERHQLRRETDEHGTTTLRTTASTMAIDLGTAFTKIASTLPTLNVVTSRPGDRSVFNGIAYERRSTEDDSTNDWVVSALGRSALERYHYDDSNVTPGGDFVELPYTQFCREQSGDSRQSSHSHPSFATMVSDVLAPRLQDVLDRTEEHASDTTATGHPRVRPVVTLPCVALDNPTLYTQAFPDVTVFIPEPVAAVWGAQFYNLLPPNANATVNHHPLYLVVDVGAWTTQIALVQDNLVLFPSTVTIPLGGEHVIQQLVHTWQAEPCYAGRTADARTGPVWLHTHARSAVAELATHTRVAVSIPYLFADPGRHHLETSVARTVLDAAVHRWVRDSLVPHDVNVNSLSRHLPPPTDLTTLFMSVTTHVLEQAQVLPSHIEAVLIVGGGAKTVVMHESVAGAWSTLTGGFGTPVIRPDASRRAELVVLGAATVPPSLDYSMEHGLIGRD